MAAGPAGAAVLPAAAALAAALSVGVLVLTAWTVRAVAPSAAGVAAGRAPVAVALVIRVLPGVSLAVGIN